MGLIWIWKYTVYGRYMFMLQQLTFTFHLGPFGWWQRSPLFQFSGTGDPRVFTLTSYTGSYVLTRHYRRRCRKYFLSIWRHASLLISNFRRVLNIVCFLLGNSPASELYMPTFRNTLFHLHRQVGTYLPMKTEQSVPKRLHITFRHRGITQKNACNILDSFC